MKTKYVLLFLCLFALAGNLFAHPCAYDYDRLQQDTLGRGVVAVRKSTTEVVVSWRYLSIDPINTAFVVYRDRKKVAEVPAGTGTFYIDAYKGEKSAVYTVEPTTKGKSGSYTLPAHAPIGYVHIPLDRPSDGVTPTGSTYSYAPNDASVGDVDGDGEYEIILKWDPSNAHDNAHDGYTGNVFIDCYRLTGQMLWRIDLGRNIRAGAHYTQFMVYDFDGDGRAEIIMRTSDGTTDGTGKVIGDALADYREAGDPTLPPESDYPADDPRGKPYPNAPPRNQGRILTGNEYLTVFNGITGAAMSTIDYIPPRGNLKRDWGDSRANRSDRFLAAVAYLDGVHPSVVMCRGYYTRSVLAAFDWDGKQLKQRWVFDSNAPDCGAYAGQGNHNLRVGDVDGDGCDEIVYGSCTIDHDGKGLYTTGLGHGDAIHLTQFAAGMEGLQVWACHENRKDGSSFRDASTGEVIWQIKSPTDVGRCMAADIDPRHEGLEMWSWGTGGLRNLKGNVINPDIRTLPVNMGVWWDGDLLRELLDANVVSKYDWESGVCKPLTVFDGAMSNNGTKSTPCLQGDLIGDWREEVLLRTVDNTALRLYVSPEPTVYRFHTFLEDPVYRISIATQNTAYNQPTQTGFYFGADLSGEFRGYNIIKEDTANDSNTPLHLLQPAYKVPYGTLTVGSIKSDIDRVFRYVSQNTPARIVDRGGNIVTDYTRIPPDAQLERGVFRLTSYEWGVTYSAMLSAFDATGDTSYFNYVKERLCFLAEVAPYFRRLLDKGIEIDPQLRQMLVPRALDDAGAMCSAMIKLHLRDTALGLRPLIANYMDHILHREYRLSDGTLARTRPHHNTVWLDDMYMGIPPMAWYAHIADTAYFDKAIRQTFGFTDRMWITEKGLFRHGWVESMDDHPSFCWARANGWALLTLCETLDAIPESHPDRATLLKLLRDHICGLSSFQSGDGLWHQLLDRPDSYLETSASAIYVYCIAHAINCGWIDASAYGPVALLGWQAVSTRINDRGQVEGVCVGTGMAFDPAFYYYRPVNVYAAHGYGPVIYAGAEMISLLKSRHPKINDSAIQFYDMEPETNEPIFHIKKP
jgi:rhamnogalacturonan endolyase